MSSFLKKTPLLFIILLVTLHIFYSSIDKKVRKIDGIIPNFLKISLSSSFFTRKIDFYLLI